MSSERDTRRVEPIQGSGVTGQATGGAVDLVLQPSQSRRRRTPVRAYDKDRPQLLRRLARIEGQVRGITRMIERDDSCIDIMQQTAALRAAVDSVTLLLVEDHVADCLSVRSTRARDSVVLAEEVMEVVRRTMGRPARTSRSASD